MYFLLPQYMALLILASAAPFLLPPLPSFSSVWSDHWNKLSALKSFLDLAQLGSARLSQSVKTIKLNPLFSLPPIGGGDTVGHSHMTSAQRASICPKIRLFELVGRILRGQVETS